MHLAEQLYLIDSRHRDPDLFPNTNEYSVHLGKNTSIYGMDILEASISRTQDPVSERNNVLSFRIGGAAVESVTIPPGTYSEQSLVDAVQLSLTQAGSSLQIAADGAHRCVFTHPSEEFTIYLNRPNSLHTILGFHTGPSVPAVQSVNRHLVPRGIMDPAAEGDASYIVVRTNIETMQVFSHVSHPAGAGIYLLDTERAQKWVRYPTRWFDRAMAVSTLTFRLENPDGTLYDTGYRNHVFLLRLWKGVTTESPSPPRSQA
jgi:hypothetical protein